MVVAVVTMVTVGHSEQPQLPALLELSVLMSVLMSVVMSVVMSVLMSVLAHRRLRSPPLRRRRAAAAVLEAQLGLGAPFFGEVESIRSGLERGQTEISGARVRRMDAHAFATVYGAGGENGGDDSSETLSGSGGGHGLWAGVGNVHPSNRVAPKVVRLHLFLSLSLSMYSKKG